MNATVDPDTVPWLHVYAQLMEHDDAYVVGTRAGLLALRNAIDTALADDAKATATTECFVGDGEGYSLRVAVISQASAPYLAVPYTDNLAVEQRNSTLRPADLFI